MIKNAVKNLIEKASLKPLIKRILRKFWNASSKDIASLQQQHQLIIVNQWKDWKMKGISPYKSIQEAGFRCYSEFEEDGIILYLMTMLGISKGTVVEICCGTGDECMAANLIINHGFKGFLFDGNHHLIKASKLFYIQQKDCRLYKPYIAKEWITAENVNTILKESGCPRDVDLFSLDIDGNDYWIWQAIDWIKPKVCCFETHNIIPTDLSLTVPYKSDFNSWISDSPEFRSVSLKAMVRLSESKGYTLVGAHRHGFNIFLVRNDLLSNCIERCTLRDVHDNLWTRYSQAIRWDEVKDMPWQEV